MLPGTLDPLAHARREGDRAPRRDLALAELLRDEKRLGTALHRAARLNLLTGDLARAREAALKAVERLENADAAVEIDRAGELR